MGIVEIKAHSTDPAEAAAIANETLIAFRNHILKTKLDRTKRWITAIRKVFEKAEQNRARLQNELESSSLTNEERARKEQELLTAKLVLEKEKQKVTNMTAATSIPDLPLTIISYATPPIRPVSPNLFSNILLSLGLASVFGLTGVALLLIGIFSPPGKAS